MKKFLRLVIVCCSLSAGLFAGHTEDLAAAYTTLENLKQAQAPASEIDAARKALDDLMNMQVDDICGQTKNTASTDTLEDLQDHFLGLVAVIIDYGCCKKSHAACVAIY